ncbi:MAG TPA: response regulator [Chthoniobacteraceae bacterium]|nr:response regulator [Chthoniobacteraceae bacterium]
MKKEPVNVLLVEDNAEHVEFMEQMLAASQGPSLFQLRVANSLKATLDGLRAGGVDLIMLDLTLPDSDGLETFIRTVEAAPEVPIVVLSGISDVGLAIETVQLGAQDYLVKGHVDNHLLVRSMQYAIERKRVQLQLKKSNEELEVRVQERTAALQGANARLNREITERSKAEQEALESNRKLSEALEKLRRSQEQIIRRERMHALGRMANGIAHDLNNTLAPIVGFSELLLMKPDFVNDAPRLRIYLEIIGGAAKDAAKVVGRLREFYRHRDDAVAMMPVVINDVIQQAVALTQPKWKDQAMAAGVNIEMRLELGIVPTVAGNEQELGDAIANLIFNAADAITRRGIIIIRTEAHGHWLSITVTDDGVGMNEETRSRCMEPFFTTKGDQAAGLGLGSVYGIVQRHDGELDIQSELGRGTAVSISLPLERGLKAPSAVLPAMKSVSPLQILVVEDEPLVREVLNVYLMEDNHQVVMASNGREGLEQFRSRGFDLVLTDRAMPEMNGDELAGEIRRLKPDQRIVLLTGFGDLMSGSGEHPRDVDLVVSKPFTLTTLREAISRCVGAGH